jgi:ATP-dependent transcriptional regulator
MPANRVIEMKTAVAYGAILALVLFILQWLKLRFLVADSNFEIYVGLIALVFTGLGIWLALKLVKPNAKTIALEREVSSEGEKEFLADEQEIARIGLSSRELDVLRLMADGLSNQEIASRLFVSLNTVKTHGSRLFEKMDVRRRTQAVDKAKKLRIIP